MLLCFLIAVDDGTGILQCVQFQPNPSVALPGVTGENLPPTLADLVQSVVAQKREYVPKLGDCVNIRGKLNVFREQPQLIINQLRILFKTQLFKCLLTNSY